MVKIQNTLSRWHKIIGRTLENIREMDTEIQTLLAPRRTNSATYNEASVKAAKDLNRVTELMSLRQNASEAVGIMRKALAKANVQYGVSDLLTDVETVRRNIASIQELTNWREDGPAELANKAKNLISRADEAKSSNSEYALEHRSRALDETIIFRPVDEETSQKAKAEVKAKKALLVELSDKLSDLNATKLAIEFEEVVAKAANLVV